MGPFYLEFKQIFRHHISQVRHPIFEIIQRFYETFRLLVGISMLVSTYAIAEEHQLGFEGSILGQQVKLSEISSNYRDVSSGGGWSFFYLHQKTPNFRIGGGAFGLSGGTGNTDLSIFGGGMIVEGALPIAYRLEACLSGQLGGAGTTVTNKANDTEDNTVKSGEFSRGGGWLFAPEFTLGYSFHDLRLYGFVKRTQFFAGSEKIAKLSNTSAGIGTAKFL